MTTMRAACVFHSGKQKSVLPSILTLGAISKIEAREKPRKKHDIQFEYAVLRHLPTETDVTGRSN